MKEETRNKIIEDFIFCFQTKYGEEWIRNLDKKLSPSPNIELARRYNVPIRAIRGIRQEIRKFGIIVRAFFTMEADEEMNTFENEEGDTNVFNNTNEFLNEFHSLSEM